MPTSADPLADPRYDDLVQELRAARPEVAEALRTRVLAAAAASPPPRRRAVVGALRVVVPFAATLLVVAGVATGLRTLDAGGGDDEAAAGSEPAPALTHSLEDETAAYGARARREGGGEALLAPPASPSRLQEQRIALGVRVDDVADLADATARAMAATRSLGGYVVAAQYSAGADAGDSRLVVRIPVTRVQEAIARFTALGTIVSQDVQLQDLQAGVDRRAGELERLRARIARLEERLAAPTIAPEERATLRRQLASARRAVQTRVAQQRAAEQRGRLARVELSLTTEQPAAADENGAAATFRAAADLLLLLLTWLGAALLVATPFLLLGFGVAAGLRRRRGRFA